MKLPRLLAILVPICISHALAAPSSPRWRGVVEGFNDTPWTHAQRLDALRWMGAHGMNVYIYAPKRDPFHRERWREPYPLDEVKRFAELARAGRKAGVEVIVAISPGLDMHYSRSEDVLALEDKIDALNAAGVQHFAVFFDDIPWELQFDDDEAKYQELGAAQVDVLNQVIGHLRHRGIEGPYITVGTQYYDLKETPYKRAYREHLDKMWDVMWTGDGGPKRATITPDTVREWTKLWGRKPFIWDNYPVNDYNKDRLFFAPVVQRGDIGGLVSGYAFNPLTQPTLARLTLYTGAEYLRNTAAYKPWASWKRAKDELFGRNPKARALMHAMVGLNTARPFGPQGSPEMLTAVGRALKPGSSAGSTAHLRSVLTLCAQACARLAGVRAALPHPEVCDEMAPWLPAIERGGRTGLLALDVLSQRRANGTAVRRLKERWEAAQTGKRVAPEPLGQLVRGALDAAATRGAVIPPSPRWRGVVEGFYGPPYTHAERLRMIRWMGGHGQNLYIYGPKEDPYHRDKWRETYPAKDMRQFAELAKAGDESGVLLMVAISPGNDIHYSSAADRIALFAKIDALAAAGVQRFAIFLDDIDHSLQFDDDKAAYPNLGEAQVDLLNATIAHLRQSGLDKPFITVDTTYYTLRESPYKKAFREKLDSGVLAMWTGEGVITQTLTPQMCARFEQVYGRKPFLWDNYPVNDPGRDRLYMGPLEGRTNVGNVVSGFVMNPMNQPNLSRLPLFTCFDFLNDTAAYKPWPSWKRAKDEVFGKDPRTRPTWDAIADLCTEDAFNPGNGPVLTPLVDAYLGTPTVHTRAALKAFLERCVNASNALAGPLADEQERLVDEVKPWLPHIAKAGEAGLLALELAAKPKRETAAALQAAWASAQTQPHIVSGPLSTLLKSALRHYYGSDRYPGPRATSTMPSFGANAPENAADGLDETCFWSGATAKPGDNLTVDFLKPRTVSHVEIHAGKPGSPDDFIHDGALEVSEDGKVWNTVGVLTQAETIANFAAQTVRYVRLTVNAGQPNWVAVREIAVR